MILQCTMERDEDTGVMDVTMNDGDGKFIGWIPAVTFYVLFGFTPKRGETVKIDATIEVKRL